MFATLLLAASLTPAQSPSPGRNPEPLPQPKPLAAPTPTPPPTPTLADCLGGCPSPPASAPFLRLPHVELLGSCRDSGGCGQTPTNFQGDPNRWHHTFHTAARFVIPRFDQSGGAVEADGLVVYEGMQLTVNSSTGVYELTFTATAPPTPVVIRLQLHFSQPGRPEACVKLTLPPIEIDVDTGSKVRPLGPTVRVNHRGFSELFIAPAAQSHSSDLQKPTDPLHALGVVPVVPFQINKDWVISRTGTARFGSALPASSDDPGR